MGVGIEWTSGILRAGTEYHQFGDEYTFACSVLKDRNQIILKGGAGEIPPRFRRDLRAELKKIGIQEVSWEIKTRDGYAKQKYRLGG